MRILIFVAGALIVSFVAIRLWVGLIDMIKAGLKKLNPFAKKQTVVWHTLDELHTTKEVDKNQLQCKKESIEGSDRVD